MEADYVVLGIGFGIIGLATYGLYDIVVKILWKIRTRKPIKPF